jgi:hypothetical protein
MRAPFFDWFKDVRYHIIFLPGRPEVSPYSDPLLVYVIQLVDF